MILVPVDWPSDLAAWLTEHGPVATTSAGLDMTVHPDGLHVTLPAGTVTDLTAAAPAWVRWWVENGAPR